jgi:predicted nucleic acid-binding protein
MKPRLYLETTIPSYLVARPSKDLRLAADQQATREWWDQRRHDFDLFVSEVVVSEAGRGDSECAATRLEKLRHIPILDPLPAGEQLAERLLTEGIIPPVAADDAIHLGFAAAHKMDYLLTWNCRHINNRALQRRIEHACVACGLICPVICTPTELMSPL